MFFCIMDNRFLVRSYPELFVLPHRACFRRGIVWQFNRVLGNGILQVMRCDIINRIVWRVVWCIGDMRLGNCSSWRSVKAMQLINNTIGGGAWHALGPTNISGAFHY